MDTKVISLSEMREKKKKSQETHEQPSSEVVRLWRLSMAMDDLIKNAVLNDSLPADEVSTIFANRLGTLIGCCENSPELAKFCCEIIMRMNSNDKSSQG